jgi:glycerol-3-phosphate dehydrogenase
VTPIYRWTEVPYIYAGLKFYDLIAGTRNIGSSSYMSRSRAMASFPMIRAEGLKAGVKYFDGQFNDARMAVALAVTALRQGAVMANHLEAVRFVKKSARISGVAVRDVLTGDTWTIQAKVIVNATGPFADNIRHLDDPGIRPMLKITSGVHILLDERFSPPDTGLLIPKTEDGRILFILPWEGSTLVGTTDRPAELSDHPRPTAEEIAYLEHYICRHFDLTLTQADIKATWSGLRPLIFDPKISDSAKLSRDHIIVQSPSGLLTIAGGKWTTYRKMAADTVDYAIRCFGLKPSFGCQTEQIFIEGGENYDPNGVEILLREFGLDEKTAYHLNRAYGDRSFDVAAIAASGYGAALSHDHPFLEAEVIYGVRHEMAQRTMDILARRTPLALLDTMAATKAAQRVLEIMATELDWDDARRTEEGKIVRKRLREGI